MAKISIIIPVYKVEQYLPECLDSVINQTYKNLEIICVDDGSPDNSGKILDEYASKDNRIKVIHKENGGVSSARNAGLDIATGDWISFVDADDYIASDFYDKLIGSSKDGEADVVQCGYTTFGEDFNRIKIGIGRDPKFSNLADFVLSKIPNQTKDILEDSCDEAVKLLINELENNFANR